MSSLYYSTNSYDIITTSTIECTLSAYMLVVPHHCSVSILYYITNYTICTTLVNMSYIPCKP